MLSCSCRHLPFLLLADVGGLDARVDGGIDQVDGQQDDGVDDAGQDDGAAGKDAVAALDRLHQHVADAGPGVNRLDDGGAAQRDADQRADLRDDRDPRVADGDPRIAQLVAVSHLPLRHALGAGGAQEVGAGDLKDGGAGLAADTGDHGEAVCKDGQHEGFPGAVIGSGEDLQLAGEPDQQHQTQPEARHGNADHREGGGQVVPDAARVLRREDAQRNGHHCSQQHREQRQPEGVRPAGAELRPDRQARDL